MSTKTLRKRIALVAVSAMGFGLLSAAPSNAAVSFASIANAGPVRVNGAAVNVSLTGSAGSSDLVVDAAATPVVYVNTSKPVGSSFTFTPAADGTLVIDAATVTVGTIAVNTAGTYTGYIFYDADNSGTLGAGEAGAAYSFTTSGAAASISASAASASVAAGINNTVTVNLLDSSASLTESLASEFVTVAATATGNVTLTDGTGDGTWSTNGTPSVTGSFAYSALKSGTFNFLAKDASAGETVTVVITPSLALSLAGVTAKTVTFTTVAVSVLTSAHAAVATSTTVSADAADSTSSLNAYYVAPSQTTVTYSITGLEANKSFVWDLTLSGITATIDGASYTTGTDTSAIAAADGTYTITATYGSVTSGDYATLDLNTAATGQETGQINAKTIYATPVYAVTVSSPSVSPILTVSGAAITVSGSIADQYGNPLSGAVVTVLGTSTPSGSDKTATVASTTTGAFSVTLPAAAAATTSLSIVASAVKTGVGSITDGATKVVNFSATGLATAATILAGDGAAAVGDQTLTIPALILPTDGVPSTAITNEIKTLATGATSGAAAGEYLLLDSVTTPMGASVTYTAGDSSVYLSSTAPTTAFSGASTATVYAGTDVYAWSTKPGTHTVTMTSGTLTSTKTFVVAVSPAGAARNVALSGPSTLVNGNVGSFSATVTDAFGNPVAGVALVASTVGLGFINGSLTSATLANTDASGVATFQLVGANGGTGTVTTTVTGTATQMTAAAGVISGSTAGTNGMSAGNATAAVATTITSSTTATLDSIAAAAATAAADAAANKAATDAAIAALAASLEAAKAQAAADKVLADAAVAAATAAAKKAGDDAVAAAKAASDAAVEAAAAATDAATEAGDAANAAMDAAYGAAESADAATAAGQDATDKAQEAVDAVATLSAQVATLITALKAQLTALTNLVIKIQKKVKA